MSYIKLKDNVPFDALVLDYGFIKDEANCENPEDHYYWLNNYYYQGNNDFRITINMLNRKLEILCLAKEEELYQLSELIPIMELIEDGLLEIIN